MDRATERTPAAAPRWRLGWPCGVVVAGALVLWLEGAVSTAAPVRAYDEGIALTETLRLAQGELPWRDYDPVYGPLEPALLVPAAWAFGPQLLALRALRGLSAAAAAGVALALARRLGPRDAAAPGLAPAAALLVLWFAGPLTHPVLLPLLGSALALDRARGPRGLVGCGAVLGAAGLYRPEFGVLAAVAAGLALLARRWLPPDAGEPPARATPRASAWVGAGALPFVLAWVALALIAGPARVLEHARVTRAHLPFRALPWPLPPPDAVTGLDLLGHLVLFGLVPLAAVGAVVAFAWRAARAATPAARPTTLELHLLLLLVGLVPYTTWRPDTAHVLPALALVSPLLVAAAARALPASSLAHPAARLLPAGALALLLLGRSGAAAVAAATGPELVLSRQPALGGVLLPAVLEAEYEALRRAVDAHAGGPDAPVFAGCADAVDGHIVPQHGRIHANDALLYPLLGHPVGTRHHCFLPGVTTTEARQRELVDELVRRDVRVVVLALGTWHDEPNRSREPGSRHLDRALTERYAPVADLRRWIVLARRKP